MNVFSWDFRSLLSYSIPVEISWILQLALIFIVLRIIHRIYYILNQHRHYFIYHPKKSIDEFLNKYCGKHRIYRTFVAKDGVIVEYHRLGHGDRFILLLNGVGTGFFMWLPILKVFLLLQPNFFSTYTLLVPSYRGLFGSIHKKSQKIENHDDAINISIDTCVDDVENLMKDADIMTFDTIIGWSTGAQVALSFLGRCEATTKEKNRHKNTKVVLLNASISNTLEYAFQPIRPAPRWIGRIIGRRIQSLLNYTKALIHSFLWDILKSFALSTVFRVCLEVLAFIGGFPPEQPVYFHEYMRDAFSSREHTRGLLNLILALNGECHPNATTISNRALIISGYPDFMTGVYWSNQLHSSLKNSRHYVFSMGSHFLLLEWPDIVAREILRLVHEK